MSDYYWYFAPEDQRLRYGDGRLIQAGITHTVEPPIKLCQHGLHASRRAIDALQHAPSQVVCRVSLGGEIMHDVDKSCATERTYLSVVDAEDTLLAFARRCALDVIDLWDAPNIVREYLETGDESIRAAAWAAAWAATQAATQAAALLAAWDAAWATARDARAAARAAARDAAWAAARDAALLAAWAARAEKVQKYNEWLEKMLIDAEGGHQ